MSTADRRTINLWIAGARPRTLGVSLVPVVVGTAAAAEESGGWGNLHWWRVAAALIVALALQIGTNYANDYSDGMRGTDADRVVRGNGAPMRLTASGVVAPSAVRNAAAVSFAIAAIVGLVLSLAVDPRLIVLGAIAILAGVAYTGGPRPYGYAGGGEVAVFVFFGLVATCGTAYALLEQVPGLAILGGMAHGLLAAAVLVPNNVRDLATDRTAGKRTLAVLLGLRGARILYGVMVAGGFFLSGIIAIDRPWALLTWMVIPFLVAPVRTVMTRTDAPALVAALIATARAHLLFGLLLAVGISIGV